MTASIKAECSLAAVRGFTVPLASERFAVEVSVPAVAAGVVLLARGNGNTVSRHSVSSWLRASGFATASCQLMTLGERIAPDALHRVASNVPLLAQRLEAMVSAIRTDAELRDLPVGMLASGTMAAAAMTVAAGRPRDLAALVCRSGRVDLVLHPEKVQCPTLLIAGGLDTEQIRVNDVVFQRLQCTKGYDVLAGATHRFDNPATFDLAAKLTCDWFLTHLGAAVHA